MTMLRTTVWCAVWSLAACGEQPRQGPAVHDAPRAVAEAAPLPAVPAVVPAVVDPGAGTMVRIPDGAYEPLFPGRDGSKRVPVRAFLLEEAPVSNSQFLAFVAAEPRWRRSAVARVFADGGYLAHWASDFDVGPGNDVRPVTNVSWFAARAYARWRGRRLPTIAEWERAAAMPLAHGVDAARAALDWYGKTGAAGPGPIGSGFATELGVRDLHGLVWEWAEDFASAMSTGDGRGDSDFERSLFCGAGAAGSVRATDYAAFMRYALRTSLQGTSTTKNLGFRCAADDVSQKE